MRNKRQLKVDRAVLDTLQCVPDRHMLPEDIRALSHRLDRTTIEHRDWEYILNTYDAPETFFFLDPPYLDAGGKNYGGWDDAELSRFCAHVIKLKGRWLFTFQDCAEVRDKMPGCKIKPIERAKGIDNKKGKTGIYQEVIIIDGKGR